MKLRHLHEMKYGNDIHLYSKTLAILPSDLPNRITGSFNCSANRLTSLEHCPSVVGGYFDCSNNELTSLEFCPAEVGGFFNCYLNRLTTLKDIHRHVKKIGGRFLCRDNQIESHILGLMLVEIDGNIHTKLGDGKDVDAILNKWKNQGRKGALGAQRDLIGAGYSELAQL